MSLRFRDILYSSECFWLVRTLVVAASFALLKWPAGLSLLAVLVVSGTVFLYMGVVSASVWNYNTHIIAISVLTFIAGLRSRRISASLNNATVLRTTNENDFATGLSLIFATVYFQAAISKLVVSGFDWMNSGLSIYVHLLKFNPALSAGVGGHPLLFRMAGWLTVVGEIVLGLLFICPRTRKLAAGVSVGFHLMLWYAFHISFWHLWLFYPAVYFHSSTSRVFNYISRSVFLRVENVLSARHRAVLNI